MVSILATAVCPQLISNPTDRKQFEPDTETEGQRRHAVGAPLERRLGHSHYADEETRRCPHEAT